VDQLVARCDAPTEAAICLLRNDAEKISPPADVGAQGLMKDWSHPDDLIIKTDEPLFDLKRCNIEGATAFDGDFDTKSWRRLCGAVQLFAMGREVITDRLHGHILCVMMKKPHTVLDNSYGKTGAYFRTWELPEPKGHRARFFARWPR
jgi:pyruvyl transferase EpsO